MEEARIIRQGPITRLGSALPFATTATTASIHRHLNFTRPRIQAHPQPQQRQTATFSRWKQRSTPFDRRCIHSFTVSPSTASQSFHTHACSSSAFGRLFLRPLVMACTIRPTALRSLQSLETRSICYRCFSAQAGTTNQSLNRPFSSSPKARSAAIELPSGWQSTRRQYFSGNELLRRPIWKQGIFFSPSEKTTDLASTAVRQASVRSRRRSSTQRATRTAEGASASEQLPLDASNQLTTSAAALPKTSWRRKFATYLALTKPRLSFMIVLTSTTAYSLYPVPDILALDPSMTQLPTLSTSTLTLLYLTAGTFLSSAAANTMNMYFEPKYDAMMSRTRNRPLVRKLVSSRAAVFFAAGCATIGLTALYVGTNPTVAALSAANIVLYAGIYTPLKRITVANTWVGAIVGGIPPLMGWVAAAGQNSTIGHDGWRDLLFSKDSIGGWLMAGILFAWQFPHFNALSWSIREEYKYAGYRMLAWANPAMNGRVAIRYSLLLFPVCFGLYAYDYVSAPFLAISTAANLWQTRAALRFWKLEGHKGSARALFWASVWYLPLVMISALATKKGVWDGVLTRANALLGFGHPDDDDDELYEYLEEEDDDQNQVGVRSEKHSAGNGLQSQKRLGYITAPSANS